MNEVEMDQRDWLEEVGKEEMESKTYSFIDLLPLLFTQCL